MRIVIASARIVRLIYRLAAVKRGSKTQVVQFNLLFYVIFINRNTDDQVITVGADDCKDDDENAKFCNGPLKSNKEYWLVY